MKGFFRIPKKVHHGIILVAELAAAAGSVSPLTLESVADRHGISLKFLELIATPLREAGIIKGRRGSGGGYVLTKDATTLTIADIVTAIEGPLLLSDCLSEGEECRLHGGCPNRAVWRLMQMQMIGTLRKMTLADVLAAQYA